MPDENTQLAIVLSGTTLTSSSVTISANQSAIETIIGAEGTMHITSGGSAAYIYVSSGGNIYVSAGGSANMVDLYEGGNVHVSAGGSAQVFASNGGTIHISKGAAPTGIVYSGGVVHVSEGGSADMIDVYSGGNMHILSGGTAAYGRVTADGNVYVSEGGFVSGTVVSSQGQMFISSGASASGITAEGGSTWSVAAKINIYGEARDLTLTSGGRGTVYGNGTVSGTTAAGGILTVNGRSDGTATVFDTDISQNGQIWLYSNAIASDTTVSGGYITIQEGGAAIDNTLTGGFEYINSNGSTTRAIARIEVSSGGTASNTVISGGVSSIKSYTYMTVSSGGTAINTTVAYGYLRASGGNISNTIVESDGVITVESSASEVPVFTDLTVKAGGSATLGNATVTGDIFIAEDAVVSGGNFLLDLSERTAESGFFLEDISLLSGYTLTVNVSETQGGGLYKIAAGAADFTDSIAVYCGEEYLGSISTSSMEFYNRQTYALVKNEDELFLKVDPALVVSSAYTLTENIPHITVADGGILTIASGGAASTIEITDGGSAQNIKLIAGSKMHVSSGGMAADTTVSSGGHLYVSSGGSASGISISEFGSVHISSGASASGISATGGATWTSAGHINVYGGTIEDVTLFSGGRATARQNGTISNTTVHSGGVLTAIGGTGTGANSGVTYSAALLDTTISGGALYISSNVIASNNTVSGGYIFIGSDGTAVNNTLYGGFQYVNSSGSTARAIGRIVVSSGGTASNTIISGAYSSGAAKNYTHMAVSAGGTAINTTVAYGMLSVDGDVSNTIVESDGVISALTSATVTDITIKAGGSATFSNSATVTGDIHIAKDAVVSGGNFVLDFSERTAESDFFFEDLSQLSGYTLTINVAENQTSGLYKIAAGAADFNETVTVTCGDTVLGQLTVGDPMQFYSLVKQDGELYFQTQQTFVVDSRVTVSSSISNVVVTSSGYLSLVSGGAVNNAAVSSGGYIYVSSGATVSGAVLSCYGCVYVSSGATVTGTIVSSGANLYVSSAGSAHKTTVLSGGYISITSGATYTDTTVAGGSLTNTYGTLSGTTILSNGYVTLRGTMSDTTVSSGRINVLGGKLFDTTVSSGGSVLFRDYPNSGFVGSASGVLLESGGNIIVSSGGSAVLTDVTIESAGVLTVLSAGSATITDFIVNAGGSATLGDTAVSGNIHIAADTFVTGGNYLLDLTYRTPNSIYFFGDISHLSDYTLTVNVSADQGTGLYRLAAGANVFTDSITVTCGNALLGQLSVNAPGVVHNGLVFSVVTSDDILYLKANKFERQIIDSALTIKSSSLSGISIVSSGSVTLNQYGSVHDAEVLTGGRLAVMGTAQDIQINGGYVTVGNSGTITNALLNGSKGSLTLNGVASNTTVSKGTFTQKAGSSYNTVLLGSGARMTLNSGYTENLTVSSGASFSAFSGAVIGGKVNIEQGGFATFNSATLRLTLDEVLPRTEFLFDAETSGTYTLDTQLYVSPDQAAGRYFIGTNLDGMVMIGDGVSSNYASGGKFFVMGSQGYILNNAGGVLTLNVFDMNKGSATISEDTTVSEKMENVFISPLSGTKTSVSVASGGEIDHAIVSQGATLDVLGGGVIKNVTNSSGILHLSSGAYAENTDVFGTFTAFSGAIVKDAAVFSGGIATFNKADVEELSVFNSGSATFTAGSLNGLTVRNNGYVSMTSDTVVTGKVSLSEGCNVSGGTYTFDFSSPEAQNLTIEGLAYWQNVQLNVNFAQTPAAGKYVLGSLNGSYSGTITVNGSYTLYLNSNGNEVWGDAIFISGTAYRIDQQNDRLYIEVVKNHDNHTVFARNSSGGSSWSDILVENKHLTSLTVSSGGIARNNVISGGTATIFSGGTAISTTLLFGGSMHISGGEVSGVTVLSSGYLRYSLSGSLHDVLVSSGGRMHVSLPTGRYSNKNEFSNITLLSGAVFNSMTVMQDNFLEEGLNLSGLVASSAASIGEGITVNDLTVCNGFSVSGGSANNVVMSGSSMSIAGVHKNAYTQAFGKVNGAEVYSGAVHVGYYGELNDGFFHSGTSLTVTSQGIASKVTIDSGAYALISGKVYDLNLQGGEASFYTMSGTGKIKGAEITSGGRLTVQQGTVDDVLIGDSGLVIIAAYSNGIVNDTLINYNGALLISSGTANDTVISSGGQMFMAAGSSGNAHADGVTVSSGGLFQILSGATSDTVDVNNVTVYSGGTFLGFTLNSDQTFDRVLDSALHDTISGATVTTPEKLESHLANYLSALPSSACVGDGGVLIDTTIIGNSNGRAHVTMGINGFADSTVVASKAWLSVNCSASADNTIVYSGGWLSVNSGGSATNVILNSGGSLYLKSGSEKAPSYVTVAYNPWGSSVTNSSSTDCCIIQLERDANVYYGGSNHRFTDSNGNGGVAFISKFDSAVDFSVASGNSAIVYSGGMLENVYVNYGGILRISSGGSATIAYNPFCGQVTRVQGGSFTKLVRDANVYYGGSRDGFLGKWDTATDLEITSTNSAIVYSLGVVENTTVHSGGYMTLHKNALATGTLHIAEGGSVNFNTGAEFVFDLTEAVADDENFIITNHNLISGAPTYSIVVRDELQGGTYKLASGIYNTFPADISITVIASDDTQEYGTLTVNGDTVTIENEFHKLFYTLSLKNNELTLDIRTGGDTKAFLFEGNNLLSGANGFSNKSVAANQTMLISSGGLAKGTTVNGGKMSVSFGGSATGTTVKDGSFEVVSGGDAANVTTTENGVFTVDEKSYASGINLKGGSVSVEGSASNVTVTSGVFTVATGGVVSGLTVNAGGSAYIAAGAVVTGSIKVNEAAFISFDENSRIAINYTERTTGSTFALETLALLTGAKDITLDLNAEQTFGKYRLAQSGAGFEGVFSVLCGETTLATLSLANRSADSGKNRYSIIEENNALYFEITRNSANGNTAADNWEDLKENGAASFGGDTLVINDSAIEAAGWTGYGDATDFFKVDLTAAHLAFDISANDNIKFTIYSLEERNGSYSLKALQTTAVSVKNAGDDTFVTSKELKLKSGTYFISIDSTNAAKGGSADYTFKVSDRSQFFPLGNNADDWQDFKENGVDGFKGEEFTLTGAKQLIENGWVGYGDNVDFFKFNINSAAKLSFNIDAAAAAKFVIYSFDEAKNTRKALQTVNLKLDKETGRYVIDTAALFLEEGSYYASIESTAEENDYKVNLNENSVFYTLGNNADDWEDFKENGVAGFKGEEFTLTENKQLIENGWVGYGDKIDFFKFNINSAAKLSFNIDAAAAAKFVIYSFDEGKNTRKALQTVNLKLDKETGRYVIDTAALLLEEGSYYASIESTAEENDYKVDLNSASFFYTLGNNADDWEDFKENGVDGFKGEEYTITEAKQLIEEGWVGYGDNIDFFKFDITSAAKLSFTIDAGDAAKFVIYSFDETRNTRKALQTVNLKLDKETGRYVIDTAALLLEEGSYYASVESTNAAKGGNADYKVSVNGDSVFYTSGNNADDWTTVKEDGEDGLQGTEFTVTQNGDLLTDGWVGYDDAVDYFKITLEDAAKLSFHVESGDAMKFAICSLTEKSRGGKTTYSISSLQTSTLKLDKETGRYVIDTKGLLLTQGDYYIMVQSTNAAKGGNADYTISVNGSTFFDDVESANNWEDLKNDGANGNVDTSHDAITQKGYTFATGWVGYGDEVDYMQFDLEQSAKLSFTVTSTDAAKFVIYTLVEKKDKKKNTYYTLKALQSSTLKLDKNTGLYVIDTKGLVLNGNSSYYIGIFSSNAKKGGNAEYEIKVNDSTVIFDGGNNEDDIFDINSEAISDMGTISLATEESFAALSGWVGMDDTIDYAQFHVEGNLKVNFNVMTSDALQLIIYTIDANGKLKKLQTTNFKADTTATSKDITLNAGTYYLSVSSPNAAKGGNAAYVVTGKSAGITIKIDGVSDEQFENILANFNNCECDKENFNFAEHYANCIPDMAKKGIITGTPSNDKVQFLGSKSRFVNGIVLGDGNDEIRLENSNTAAEYDLYLVGGNEKNERCIALGDGDDKLYVGAYNCLDGAELISFGEGNDTMEIAANGKVYTYTNDDNTGLEFGNGDDKLIIRANGFLCGVPSFGEGNDTLQLEGVLKLEAWGLHLQDLQLEKVTGKGYLVLTQDATDNLSASDDIIRLFQNAGVKIINSIAGNMVAPQKEQSDNTIQKAVTLAAKTESDIWLCGSDKCRSVRYGYEDSVDYIKFTKNDEIDTLTIKLDESSAGILLERLSSSGAVLESYTITGSENVIDLSGLENGLCYFRLSTAATDLSYGTLSIA